MCTRTSIIALVILASIGLSKAGQAPRLTRVSNAGSIVLEPGMVLRLADGASLTLGIENEQNAKYYEIQWYRNSEPLAGATGPVLRIQSTEAMFSGSYHARLATPCSQITTAPVFVERDQINNDVVSKPLMVADIELDDIYPNPVTDKATITFRLPKALNVKVFVTDLVGNSVATVVNTTLPAGLHSVEYVVRGTTTSSSMYNVVLEAPGYSVVKPMLVVK